MIITTYIVIYANGYRVECRTQNRLQQELRVSKKSIYNMFQRGFAVFKDLDVVEVQRYYNNLLVATVKNSEREKLGVENENDLEF